MVKKPLIIKLRNWIIIKIINPIKYFNVKWCFDESKCDNPKKDCESCDYYNDCRED